MTYIGATEKSFKKGLAQKKPERCFAELRPFFPNKQNNHFNAKTPPCVSAPAPSRGACGS